MHRYRINQFLVESDVLLPCDPALQSSDNPTGTVQIHASSDGLDEFSHLYWIGRRLGGQGLRSYYVGTGVLVCIGENVRMFIDQSGTSIALRFDASDALQHAQACACAINLGLSICTLFQGQIPLHGAGLEINGKCISLVAPSGTGKSTLLWALLDQGARFACDDVVPVYCEEDAVTAMPSLSLPSKLGLREMDIRGLCREDYQEALPGQAEYWIPIPSRERVLERKALSAIFVLQSSDVPEFLGTVRVFRNQGADALSLLLDNTQGLWAVAAMLDAKELFARYRKIAVSVPVYMLQYHRHPGIVSHLVRVVKQIAKDGLSGLAQGRGEVLPAPTGNGQRVGD